MKKQTLVRIALAATALALSGQGANATVLNLTAEDSSGFIGTAFFLQIDPQSTGTGVIDSFVQVSSNQNVVSGYNTTTNNVFDTGAPDNFNHSIQLQYVPVVNIGGTFYREFLLDINENNNAANDQYLSLDELQVFLGGTANSSTETLLAGGVLGHDGNLIWDMDAVGTAPDSWIALNYALNTGSGSGDMFFYLPETFFTGLPGTTIVTLYSLFGQQGTNPTGGVPAGIYGNSDGFEEWAVRVGESNYCETHPEDPNCQEQDVPEPGTLALLGLGLLGIGLQRRRSRS